jgi:hypothetical protein
MNARWKPEINALHNLALVNLTVANFVGTGSFLIRFLTVILNKHIAKKFSDYLNKYYYFN